MTRAWIPDAPLALRLGYWNGEPDTRNRAVASMLRELGSTHLDHPAGQVAGTTMHRASTRCGGLRRTATYVTGDQHRRPPFTWEAQCRFVESLLGDSPPGTLALLLRGTSPPDTAKPAEQAVHQWLRHSCTQAEAKPLVEPGRAEHEEPWTHAALRLARWAQVAQADTLETTARWLANSEAGQHTATDQSSCISSMQTESAGGNGTSTDRADSVDSAVGANSGDNTDNIHSGTYRQSGPGCWDHDVNGVRDSASGRAHG
jgi:hypothetical protein